MQEANDIIANAKKKMADAIAHLEDELKSYRAGKANPSVFNGLLVNYYGNPTPLPQVSSINVPDARTMLITPWEKNLIPVIEKAIMDANLGFTPQNNGEQIRINVPPLTEDRRRDLVKKSKGEGENAKISIRNARRDGIEALKKAQKDGLPEDVEKDSETMIQKDVDAFNKKVDEILAAKEKEILTV